MKKPQTPQTVELAIRVTRWIWNTLFHQVVAVVAVCAVWVGLLNHDRLWPSWHVILSTLGYIPLMAEGILLFAVDNVWTQELNRKQKYLLHGVLLLFGTVLSTAGTAIAIYSKGDRPNFTTIHGITGFTSMVLVLVSFLLGFVSANATMFSGIARPVWFKFIHNFLGIAGYVIGIVSLIYGYETGWFRNNYSETACQAIIIATALVTAWSLYAAIISGYNQLKTIFSR